MIRRTTLCALLALSAAPALAQESSAYGCARLSEVSPVPYVEGRDGVFFRLTVDLRMHHPLSDVSLDLMRQLRDDARFRFLFVGTGGRRKALTEYIEANDIRSVEMRPFVPRDKLSEGLAAGDIGLVTQQESACGSVVPSKVYGILAAQRPLLFIGPAAATPARIIRHHGCGWHFECGDVEGVSRLLERLAENRHLVTEAGQRARQALVSFYDLPQSVDRIGDILGAAPATGPKTRGEAEPLLKRANPLPN